MPALVIFRNFTTRPFASDDMQLVCIVLGFYRFIQFVCLAPLTIYNLRREFQGENVWVDGIPRWYPGYNSNFSVPLFSGTGDGDLGLKDGELVLTTDFEASNFLDIFMAVAIAYFAVDVTWICLTWSSASIGTPTQSLQRDGYIRKLLVFKAFATNIFPIVLIASGIGRIYELRANNYFCAEGDEPINPPDEGVWFAFFSILLVTYALELLIWPAIIANFIIRLMRKNPLLDRSRLDSKARRFEFKLGIILKCVQFFTCNKVGGSGLKNKGELSEFATNIMHMLNNDTKFDLVLSDMFVGLKLLARVQAEQRVEAIKNMAAKNALMRKQWAKEADKAQHPSDPGLPDVNNESLQMDTVNDANTKFDDSHEDHNKSTEKERQQRSLIPSFALKSHGYGACERKLLLESSRTDKSSMHDAAHYCKYASCIYVKIQKTVIEDFFEGQEVSVFKRQLDVLFQDDFRLSSIGCDHAILFYSNFVNGLSATPYSILVDTQKQSVVIVIRGTRSLEDIVIDLQYIPASLDEVGKVCGFDGEGHFCHQGFLTRCKWMYNDIKKSQILKSLYSKQSPYENYPLVVCGHSLGGGCASILALMLRPTFPSIRCFAYEPPGGVYDEKMSEICEDFVLSIVRNDDVVPRLSHHNFETLRDEFFNVIARIKVPKIQLFYDLRVPCSDRFLVLRNAKVLRPQEDVAIDTPFFKQLQKFRDERSQKNESGVNKIQLFLPGKIIHLTETNNKSYVAHWASRYEFNQVVISHRMVSDHDIHLLVDILRDTRLSSASRRISLAFHNAPVIFVDDDEDETDDRLFFCCSNPYGKLPILLTILAFAAIVLSVHGNNSCYFILISSALDTGANSAGFHFGLHEYTLLTCSIPDGSCETLDDFTTDFCAPYPPQWRVDTYMQSARVFAYCTSTFGVVSVLSLLVSTCYSVRKRAWIWISCGLLLTSLFQGLVFLFLHSKELCKSVGYSDITCQISNGAIEAIVALCIWLLVFVGAIHLARAGKIHENVTQK